MPAISPAIEDPFLPPPFFFLGLDESCVLLDRSERVEFERSFVWSAILKQI